VMVAVPLATPATMPLVALTGAVSGAELDHVPPVVALVKVVVLPSHTLSVPVMGLSELTVTVITETQPAGVA